jgi:hypothetical protein
MPSKGFKVHGWNWNLYGWNCFGNKRMMNNQVRWIMDVNKQLWSWIFLGQTITMQTRY